MPDITPQITDPKLIAKLRASYIAPAQKTQLEVLVPRMSEAERMELLKLIERANRELGHGHGTRSHSNRHSHRMLMLGLALLAILAGLATLGLSLMA